MECHIVARSRAGPRSGDVKQRDLDGYRNLILLCPTHHKEVDDQPAEYSAQALVEIKRRHEEWVDETLELRANVPDAFWARFKQEAEELLAQRASESDEGTFALLEGLGVYVLLTAEMLGADEMVFFIRGQNAEISLAFKYERERIFFAHAEGDGFEDGFAAFEDAATIEDHTDDVLDYRREGETENPMVSFVSAAAMLSTIAEQIGGEEELFYVRRDEPADGAEIAVRLYEDVALFAAGKAGTFENAHRSFARRDPADASWVIRTKFFLDTYSRAMEEGDRDAWLGFTANYFASSVVAVLAESPAEAQIADEKRALFAGLLRNRFFESLLMLRAADRKIEDPQIRAWVEAHADPDPEDGYSAFLPTACLEAVNEFAAAAGLDEEEEAELEPDALDHLYRAINLMRGFEDEEVQESIAQLTLEQMEWWREPEARAEILELAARADPT